MDLDIFIFLFGLSLFVALIFIQIVLTKKQKDAVEILYSPKKGIYFVFMNLVFSVVDVGGFLQSNSFELGFNLSYQIIFIILNLLLLGVIFWMYNLSEYIKTQNDSQVLTKKMSSSLRRISVLDQVYLTVTFLVFFIDIRLLLLYFNIV
ncbi:MAG: hypothetical protein NUV57_04010 [archaeon]|nr:hypothetical protein [archaeon]